MMLRIYKRYDLPLYLDGTTTSSIIPGRTVTFSSYPASLFSGDDFYQLSSGLVVLETTLGNNNQSLFNQFLKPQVCYCSSSSSSSSSCCRHACIRWQLSHIHTDCMFAVWSGARTERSRVLQKCRCEPISDGWPDLGNNLFPVQLWDM
jgi:hypothetical protein